MHTIQELKKAHLDNVKQFKSLNEDFVKTIDYFLDIYLEDTSEHLMHIFEFNKDEVASKKAKDDLMYVTKFRKDFINWLYINHFQQENLDE